MWSVDCIYCEKEIKDNEACYPVHSQGVKRYRHVHCYPKVVEQPKDYVPFGHVIDQYGELE